MAKDEEVVRLEIEGTRKAFTFTGWSTEIVFKEWGVSNSICLIYLFNIYLLIILTHRSSVEDFFIILHSLVYYIVSILNHLIME